MDQVLSLSVCVNACDRPGRQLPYPWFHLFARKNRLSICFVSRVVQLNGWEIVIFNGITGLNILQFSNPAPYEVLRIALLPVVK
jgi:hypothetical protein